MRRLARILTFSLFALTTTGFLAGAGGIEIVEGEGVVVKEGDFSDSRFRAVPPGNGRTRVRVLDALGAPVANTTVVWSVVSGGGRWIEGSPGLVPDTVTTVTDFTGEASNIFIAPGTGTVGLFNSYRLVTARAASTSGTVDLHFVTIPALSDNNPTPFPSYEFLAPAGDPLQITGTLGSVIAGAIQVRFRSAGGGGFGTAIPNAGVHIDARSADPATGPSAVCDPAPIVLSNDQGIATCNLRLIGKAGTGSVWVRLGGYAERQLMLDVQPGGPGSIRITGGDNQAVRPGERAPANLLVEVRDGGGSVLPGVAVRWEVTQGSAILDNSQTVSGFDGIAANGLRFGPIAGPVQVRATALAGLQPAVTFHFDNANPPSVEDMSPASGAGANSSFVFQFDDLNGAANLAVVNILISNAIDGRQACYLAYVPSGSTTGTLFLVNDSGDAGGPYAGSLALPGGGVIQNSQCQISGVGSSASMSGNRLFLALNLAFKGPLAGRRTFYLAARSHSGGNSGWVAKGTWTVPGALTGGTRVDSAVPARSTGAAVTLSATFSDSDGFPDLNILNILIGDAIDGRAACYVAFVRPAGQLVLVNDAGAAGGPYAGAMGIPGNGSVSNSQCRVDGFLSSAAGSGTSFTLTLRITFLGAFRGEKIIYAAARDTAENTSGWQAVGTIRIP